MAKPASRLQTVVRVKKHMEKIAKQQLVQLEDSHQKEQAALDELQYEKAKAIAEGIQCGRARATDLQTHRAFIFKLTRQITRQEEKVDDVKTQEDKKRKELTEKAQSRQMVERLEEREQQEVLKEHDREEQAMIDEIANRPAKKV